MISKNDVFTIEITDQDDRGQGIGKTSGFPLFVRHAVTGDVVNVVVTKVKKTFGFARILEFAEKSPYRVQPECHVYKRCGGCQLQNMNYQAQLGFKKNHVRECLRRIGGFKDIEVEDVIGAENIFRYRNKAQYPVGMNKNEKAVCGFFAERTHDIIECGDCLLCPEEFSSITASVIEWINENGISVYDEASGRGLVRHIFLRKGFATAQIALCIIINGKKLPFLDKLIKKLSVYKDIVSISFCVNTKRNNVILGDEVIDISGRGYIEDTIGDIRYRISPLSFYQVNPEQTKKLYDKAVEFASLTGKEMVIDLYCGIGTISLYAAKNAKKVYGIEVVPQAIEDAKENARLNGIGNVEFYAGAAEDILPELYNNGLKKADVVIVDPPRKGCDERALKTISDINPDRIVYVSCNPATLARDLKFLKGRGYEAVKVQPVDMFPMSVHVETVVLMSRKEK